MTVSAATAAVRRSLLALVMTGVALGAATSTAASAVERSARATAAASARPAARRVRHVFLVILENQSFETAFGRRSRAPYLARTLRRRGMLLRRYYAIGHNSLDNYIALVSGQAPNEDTQADCVRYSDFALRRPGLDAHGQAIGQGCVYPAIVETLPDQLEAAGLTWKGYMEDMGKDPRRESATCGHVPLGASDPLQTGTPRDQYTDKHDPFVYFHSIIDDPARCSAHVVNLEQLPKDLARAATTPNYAFITPSLCHDGHDEPCVDGEPGGLLSANAFLRKWVPLILRSPAFRRDGLLIVTFDESTAQGARMAAACCGEQPLPGAHLPPGLVGPGGGRIGALLLSPFIAAGTVSDTPYNHYSLLRSVEEIFGLAPLGYAADPGLSPLPIPPRSASTAHPSGSAAASR